MNSNLNISEIEKELKLDLKNKENYQKLIEFFHFQQKIPLKQSNYFFDTKDRLLSRHKWALRIRNENEKYTLTVKGPEQKNSDLTIRYEQESLISPVEVKNILLNPERISKLDAKPLKSLEEKLNASLNNVDWTLFCHFENFRLKTHWNLGKENVIAELDKTLFQNGTVAYELEIEFMSENQYQNTFGIIKGIFERSGIPWKFSKISKLEKALFSE